MSVFGVTDLVNGMSYSTEIDFITWEGIHQGIAEVNIVSLLDEGTLWDVKVIRNMILLKKNHRFEIKVFPILFWFAEK